MLLDSDVPPLLPYAFSLSHALVSYTFPDFPVGAVTFGFDFHETTGRGLTCLEAKRELLGCSGERVQGNAVAQSEYQTKCMARGF